MYIGYWPWQVIVCYTTGHVGYFRGGKDISVTVMTLSLVLVIVKNTHLLYNNKTIISHRPNSDTITVVSLSKPEWTHFGNSYSSILMIIYPAIQPSSYPYVH